MSFGPCAVIDQAALQHNLTVVRQHAPTAKVLAVIKANAYGHGSVAVARALTAADAFGVARLNEALTLRAGGVHHPIVLLAGVLSQTDLAAAVTHNLQLVVHSFEQLQLLESWQGAPLTVWCKLDSGMNRLGFRLDALAAVWQRLMACRAVATTPRLMTHLAIADEIEDGRTQKQIQRFATATEGLMVERSLANSAGILAWPEAQAQWVRPGLMLYGISPFVTQTATQLGLKPAMTLRTELIVVREVFAGEEVGYGGTWRATQTTRIGIAAVGYGDGYMRHVAMGTPVLLRGQVVPLVGRVAMDMIALDVSNLPAVAVGDEVVLWGADLPVERIAQHAGTIPYELVCGISQRVMVRYSEL